MYSREERQLLVPHIRYQHFTLACSGECYYEGAATIAYVLDRKHNCIWYGISICAPEDQFCKKTGREIAKRRLIEFAQDLSLHTSYELPPDQDSYFAGQVDFMSDQGLAELRDTLKKTVEDLVYNRSEVLWFYDVCDISPRKEPKWQPSSLE